jgi:hypothetical protein
VFMSSLITRTSPWVVLSLAMMSPTIAAYILASLVHQNGYGRAGGDGPQVSTHTTSRCAIVLQDLFAAETSMQVDVSRIANTRVGVHAHCRGRQLSWVGCPCSVLQRASLLHLIEQPVSRPALTNLRLMSRRARRQDWTSRVPA